MASLGFLCFSSSSEPISQVESVANEVSCFICDHVICQYCENAIFCEGHHQAWIHQKCAGLDDQSLRDL